MWFGWQSWQGANDQNSGNKDMECHLAERGGAISRPTSERRRLVVEHWTSSRPSMEWLRVHGIFWGEVCFVDLVKACPSWNPVRDVQGVRMGSVALC